MQTLSYEGTSRGSRGSVAGRRGGGIVSLNCTQWFFLSFKKLSFSFQNYDVVDDDMMLVLVCLCLLVVFTVTSVFPVIDCFQRQILFATRFV